MQSRLAPPTTAPRSSDRRPDARQFSRDSREVRDLASLISWTKVGLTPAPAPNLSAPLTARVSWSSSCPGPLAPPLLQRDTVSTDRCRRSTKASLRSRRGHPASFPPPRSVQDGSSRDCLPGSLSGFAGWRSLFPSSSLPVPLPGCAMSRRMRPVSEVSPMPGVLFSPDPVRG